MGEERKKKKEKKKEDEEGDIRVYDVNKYIWTQVREVT
jgi:hypothetical protein